MLKLTRILLKLTRMLFKLNQMVLKLTRMVLKLTRILLTLTRILLKLIRMVLKLTRILLKLTRIVLKLTRMVLKITRIVLKTTQMVMKTTRMVLKITRMVFDSEIVLNRLKPQAEKIIAEEQAGFRAGRRTTEQIFNPYPSRRPSPGLAWWSYLDLYWSSSRTGLWCPSPLCTPWVSGVCCCVPQEVSFHLCIRLACWLLSAMPSQLFGQEGLVLWQRCRNRLCTFLSQWFTRVLSAGTLEGLSPLFKPANSFLNSVYYCCLLRLHRVYCGDFRLH